MKLKNTYPYSLLIMNPFEKKVEAGEVFEVDNKEKQLIKDLKAVGFVEVKESDK